MVRAISAIQFITRAATGLYAKKSSALPKSRKGKSNGEKSRN